MFCGKGIKEGDRLPGFIYGDQTQTVLERPGKTQTKRKE
jgi:hypothetical protein